MVWLISVADVQSNACITCKIAYKVLSSIFT